MAVNQRILSLQVFFERLGRIENLLPESPEIGSFLRFVRLNLWERLERGRNPFSRCFADRMRTECGQVRFPRPKPFERLGTTYLMGGIPSLGTVSCSLAPI